MNSKHAITRFSATVWLTAVIALSSPLTGASAATLVLYPQTVGAARVVYDTILTGIDASLNDPVIARTVSADTTPAEVKTWVENIAPDSVITLGHRATDVYAGLGLGPPQIIGGLTLSPQTRPDAIGVSLSVVPSAVFDTLREVAPAVVKVYVVYDPQRAQWLIDLARPAAAARNLTLVTAQAPDLKTAAKQFQTILRNADPTDSGLWLLWDSRLVDPAVVLPEIIQRAWARRLAVFSSDLGHVRHGALFSVYPDYQKLGERLGELAQAAAVAPARLHIEPASAVERAVNLRAASRLNLDVKQSTLRRFEIIYGQ